MPFKIITLLVLLLNANCYGQTKSDTEQWIKGNIESFKDRSTYEVSEILFEGRNLVIVQPVGRELFYNIIPLQQIQQVLIQQGDFKGKKNYSIKLLCGSSSKCIMEGTIQNNKRIPNNFGTAEVKIFMDASFGENNLPKRMEKAIIHLIQLNGGKTINNIF